MCDITPLSLGSLRRPRTVINSEVNATVVNDDVYYETDQVTMSTTLTTTTNAILASMGPNRRNLLVQTRRQSIRSVSLLGKVRG